MTIDPSQFPEDIGALKATLIAEASRAAHIAAELAQARAKASDDAALIAHQKLQIEKLKRELYRPRSERTSRRYASGSRRFSLAAPIRLYLNFDRDGRPRTAYSLRHTYICLRLLQEPTSIRSLRTAAPVRR